MTNGAGDHPQPKPEFVSHVRQAQKDSALLLDFLSGRKARCLEELAKDQPPEPSKLNQLLDILQKTPEEIHQGTKDWVHLLNMRDLLAHKAAPATVESIRVTQCYVGHAAPDVERRHRHIARWLKGFYLTLTGLAFGIALLAMSLLYYADNGERILATLDGLRTEHAAVRTQAAQVFQDQKPVSCGDTKGAVFSRAQLAACEGIDDLHRRMNLTYLQLETWNRVTEPFDPLYMLVMPAIHKVLENEGRKRMRDPVKPANGQSTASAIDCSSPCVRSPCLVIVAAPTPCVGSSLAVADNGAGNPNPVPDEIMQNVTSDWNRTELRTRLVLDGLGNYLIPTLLGFVGAAVFVFRRYWTLLEESTLDGRERFLIFFRPMLGMIIGGFASLFINGVVPGDDGFRIAPGLFAFLSGYSVQFFFDLLDGFIARRLRPAPSPG